MTGHYSRVNLDDMQLVGAPVYRLSMIAEAYATKGINTLPLTHPFILSLTSPAISPVGPNTCTTALLHMVAVQCHWDEL